MDIKAQILMNEANKNAAALKPLDNIDQFAEEEHPQTHRPMIVNKYYKNDASGRSPLNSGGGIS